MPPGHRAPHLEIRQASCFACTVYMVTVLIPWSASHPAHVYGPHHQLMGQLFTVNSDMFGWRLVTRWLVRTRCVSSLSGSLWLRASNGGSLHSSRQPHVLRKKGRNAV